MYVYYHTFGCKVNQYETENVLQAMEQRGFETTKDYKKADIFIINSCSVTSQADLKLRQAVHKYRKARPGSVIVVCGCHSQMITDFENRLPEADILLGTQNKSQIPDLINTFLISRMRIIAVSEHYKGERFEEMKNHSISSKTRAIIKIQDGCDMFCSYCIIPYARGRIRSKTLENLFEEANELSLYHDEIVLVGINLSCYGKDLGNLNLADAVECVQKTGVKRIRLGSLEPELLDDKTIERLSKCESLCPHFHLSLQSGCDKTLKEMRRRYLSKDYLSIVNKLRSCFKDCAITTDIMVGFPGETEEDFEKSCEFVRSVGFTDAHIFPYSKREGTLAAKRGDQISEREKSRRAKIMSEITKESANSYLSDTLGKEYEVLFEKEKNDGYHIGYTRNYLAVKVPTFTDTLWRKTRNIKVKYIKDGYLYGEII